MANAFIETEELETKIKSKKDLFYLFKYNDKLINLLIFQLFFTFYSAI